MAEQGAAQRPIDLAAVLTDASALVGAHPLAFAGAAAVYIASGVAIEMQQLEDWPGLLIMTGASTLIAGMLQYLVLRRALGTPHDHGRVRAMLAPLVAVALHFLIWLVAGIAYVLLVFPGLYIAGRLSPAVAVATVEREGLAGSVVESWRRTRIGWWPLLLAQGLLLVPLIGVFALAGAVIYLEWGSFSIDETSLEVVLITNFLFGVVTAAGWALTGAAYRLTMPDPQGDEEIFA